MKKTFLLSIALLISFTFYAQPNLDQSEYYRVHTIKFKHGKQTEGTKIGAKYFSQSLQNLGIHVKLLKFESGPWDIMVIAPVKSNSPFVDRHGADMSKAMREIAGSEDVFEADMAHYNSLVFKEDLNYYKNLTPRSLDVSNAYRSRHIKFTHNKTKTGTAIGMKYFNGALDKIGIHNIVLESKTGAYDLMIIEPIAMNSPFKDAHSSQFGKIMLEIAGSKETLSSAMAKWNEVVLREDLHYLTSVEN